MRIPLIQINQKNEYIYSSKMKVRDLKEYVKLNFRYPYMQSQMNAKDKNNLNDYIFKLMNKGLNVELSPNSIQRKIQIDKLNSISNYIEEENNIIPNSIILGCYNRKVEDNQMDKDYYQLIKEVDKDMGFYSIDLSSDYEMIVIDGQHRLGGYFINKDNSVQDMEIPIILLFGPSLSVCSKIFIDINGNQKPVDKSLIYDLTSVLEDEFDKDRLKDKEIKSIRDCHKIIKTLYSDQKSPLYKQIRMLGTGEGAVSQAFLVEMLYPLINNGVLSNYDMQKQFNSIYLYLKSIQKTFPDDWPILDNCNDDKIQIKHTNYVLHEKKSQLSKTLGMGAFFTIFPALFEECKFDFNKYMDFIKKLANRIIWSKRDYEDYLNHVDDNDDNVYSIPYYNPIYVEGTNKVAINRLSSEISKIIFEKE